MRLTEEILNEYRSKVSHPHILEMIDKLAGLENDKYNRWVGFIQGYLWSNDIYTIDEMRMHNK